MLAGGIGIGFIMRITISLAMAQLFHQRCRRIAQVFGYRQRSLFSNIGHGGIESLVNRITLWHTGKVNRSLGQRQFTFWRA